MRRFPVVAVLIGLGLVAAAPLVFGPGVAVGSSGSKGTLLMVAFNTPRHPGRTSVSLVDVASGTRHVVLQGMDICCSAAWSPDGKWIALSKGQYVMLLRGDGRDPHQLPQLSAPGARLSAYPSFAWAPNSRSLAVNEASGHRLVIRGIDGGARVIKRTGRDVAIFNVSWSPDGRWISYDRENRGGDNGVGCCSMSLHLIHPDGSGDHTVALMRDPLQDTPTSVVWTPDGHRFAFATEASDGRDPALALVDTQSGKITALPVLSLSLIGWSTDGRELAVIKAGQPISLLLIDASGQSRALATAMPPLLAGAWSPDATKLVISGTETTTNGAHTAVDLELVDPAGGPPQVLTQLPRGSEVHVLAWRPHTPTP